MNEINRVSVKVADLCNRSRETIEQQSVDWNGVAAGLLSYVIFNRNYTLLIIVLGK